MKKLTVFTALLVTGCAVSSSVSMLGPDTYTLSVASDSTLASGMLRAKTKALDDASQYCASMGKNIVVTHIETGKDSGFRIANINFKCLNSGDPELTRPDLMPAPDIVIENH